MITVRDATHSYDGTTLVLDEVHLDLPRGRLTALVGPNGAGKSTLLGAMARLLRPDRGTVHLDGLDVTTTAVDVIATRLSVLRQDNHLIARLTVVDLVRLGRFPYSKGRLRPECHAQVERALDYVQLGPLRDRYLDQLSGGQRQRAFIAMILAQDTDYVLLDEPLNNLDMAHAAGMMSMLRTAADELDKTIVLVLHDINVASHYADHIVAMRDGAVVAQGAPTDIMRTDVLRAVFDMEIEVHEVSGHLLGLHWRPVRARRDRLTPAG